MLATISVSAGKSCLENEGKKKTRKSTGVTYKTQHHKFSPVAVTTHVVVRPVLTYSSSGIDDEAPYEENPGEK